MDKIKVFALGGLDESGKNLHVIEINDNIFVLECGVKFPDKTTPGIDYVICNYDYLKENASRIKAIILLHGHDDEVGGLVYMYEDIKAPIYCSQTTRANFLKFATHVNKANQDFKFKIIEPSSIEIISGIKFNFFHTCHNIADSSGVAIETSYGNIVYMGDYIVDNNAEENYLCDLTTIAKISEKPTALLMIESGYADRLGYTAPRHKLTPIVLKDFSEAKGRIFVSLFSINQYNIREICLLAQQHGRKIVCFDDETKDVLDTFLQTSLINYPRSNIVPIDDVNRVSEQNLLILICAYGEKIYKKMSRLATGETLDNNIVLKDTDTFIMAAPSNVNNEIVATSAIDELFKSGAKIVNIRSKDFYSMHASEEDIKMMISILKPKYYLPIKGSFKQLLSNAQLAVKMGVHLNYNSIFILDNGMTLEIDEKGARIGKDNIKTGDILIDGFGIADANSSEMGDRMHLSQDGVVIIACCVSKSARQIVAGPDIQMRGFMFVKDADTIVKNITSYFLSTVSDYLQKPYSTFDEAKQIITENILKTIKKDTGKSPMILPLIMELD